MEAEGEGRTGGVNEEIELSFDEVLPGQHPVPGQHRHVGQLQRRVLEEDFFIKNLATF